MIFLVGLLLFIAILVVLGIVAAAWDPYGEREDARRRNGR